MLLSIILTVVGLLLVLPIGMSIIIGFVFDEIPSWEEATREWDAAEENLTAWKYVKYYLS